MLFDCVLLDSSRYDRYSMIICICSLSETTLSSVMRATTNSFRLRHVLSFHWTHPFIFATSLLLISASVASLPRPTVTPNVTKVLPFGGTPAGKSRLVPYN